MIAVSIPGLSVAVVNLDEADAAFGESASEEAAVGEVSFSVEFACGSGFLLEVEGIGGGELHAEGGFHGFDAGLELVIATGAFDLVAIEASHEFELGSLCGAIGGGIAEEGDKSIGSDIGVIDIGALMGARQEGAGPEN